MVGTCFAVGTYDGSLGDGMIDSLKSASWSSIEAPVPPNAFPPAVSSLRAVSCAGTSYCVAVGSYDTGQSGSAPAALLDALSGGTWTALEAPLPANADPDGTSAVLSAVSCSKPRDCVAIGDYMDSGFDFEPLIDVETGGTWIALEAPLPAGVVASSAALDEVSCTSATVCAVAGTYTTATGGDVLPFADTLTGTAWNSTALPLPAGAAPSDSVIGSLSCSGSVFCLVPVSYGSTTALALSLDVRSSNGWTATSAPVPASVNASSPPGGTSCAAASECAVVGSYQQSTGGVAKPFILTLTQRGYWFFSEAPVPHTGETLQFVSCPVSSECTAAGEYYLSGLQGPRPFLDQEISEAWWLGSFVDVTPVSEAASSFDGLDCPTGHYCIAVGTFRPTGNEPSFGFVATTPHVSLAPATAAPGATVTASLSGFAQDESVSLHWKSGGGTVLAHLSTNGSGTVKGTFVVPAGTAGTERVYAIGARGERAWAVIAVS